MINVYVNSNTIDLNDSLHENCSTILKPSTMIHIAHKLLHLAATNNTDGGHYNTRFRDRIIIAFCHHSHIFKISKASKSDTKWRIYWNYVCGKKEWVQRLLAVSAVDAPNRGSVFSFEEFKLLTTITFDAKKGIPFPVWIRKRFLGVTLLFGALRSEQLHRFRKGGLKSIEYLLDNKDDDHCNL